MESLPSLTRVEAEARAALITVERYDIDIDMTDMLEGSDFHAVSTVRFSCRTPGSSTFVDAALDVVSATLNGVAISEDKIGGARIELDDLAADNELVVASVQPSTAHGEWVHRSVDPSDKEVYVWTSFEPDDARQAWGCFDQPDLKAPHRFTVTAPAPWTVVSNSGDPVVKEVEGARQWAFPDTPPLSTYVPVVNAGPFHEVRSERAGFDLGLLARRSLATFLDRDAEELFEVTAQGLEFFGDRFGLPFPERKYDQVFLPDMGGAMENYGCVSLDRRGHLPQRAQPRRAGAAGAHPASRDGPHVVRGHRDDALVGGSLAQRGVRRVGVPLGGGGRDPVHRCLGGLPGRREAVRLLRRHGTDHAPGSGNPSRTSPPRSRASTGSPIPREPASSSSCTRSSARRASSTGSAPTSAGMPGGTPASTT